jgi:hypothetical protein
MKTIRGQLNLVWSAVLLLLVTVTSLAQAPLNLAGRWTLIPETQPQAARGRGATTPATAGSGWGQQITITQEANRLVIDRAQFASSDMQPPMRVTFALDGSESRNAINIGRGPQEQISRAVWKGQTLVVTTRYAAPPAEVTYVFSLAADNTLVIEMTRPGEAPAATTRARYRKN